MSARFSRTVAASFRVCLLIAVAVTLAGCGSKGNVRGKVYFKDKPLPSGLVTFVADNKTLGSGAIQADGSYEVKNVKTGEAIVLVSTGMPALDKSGNKTAVVQIPAEYGDPAKSKKRCTVTGGDQEYDIKLD